MKPSPIWTYEFSITLTSDLHDLTLSIIDLLTIRSPIWRYNYRFYKGPVFEGMCITTGAAYENERIAKSVISAANWPISRNTLQIKCIYLAL